MKIVALRTEYIVRERYLITKWKQYPVWQFFPAVPFLIWAIFCLIWTQLLQKKNTFHDVSPSSANYCVATSLVFIIS
jgi:hypothetical protein